MPEIAYLFERFPSFGQTFCYREVAELERQGTKVHVYSIRRPADEPKQDWDQELVRRGLCWWYRKYAPGDRVLEGLENKAREARKGLWADPQSVPPWEWGKQRK